jgi:hypothetical protein
MLCEIQRRCNLIKKCFKLTDVIPLSPDDADSRRLKKACIPVAAHRNQESRNEPEAFNVKLAVNRTRKSPHPGRFIFE